MHHILQKWGLIILSALVILAGCTPQPSASNTITLIYSEQVSEPVAFAIEQLKQSLNSQQLAFEVAHQFSEKAHNTQLIIGLSDSDLVRSLSRSQPFKLPEETEALLLQQVNAKQLLATGFDERGTMYALLELSQQIKTNRHWLRDFKTVAEVPYASERSLSTYVKTEHVLEGYWHDDAYWDRLFEQLAYSRINYYDLIFKVKPPIYTLFFDVDGFSKEEVGGNLLPSETQLKNLNALQRITDKAHAHGVNLTLGIWNHVHNPEDADRLAPYTEQAIAKLMQQVPFDAFQFRMHWESGLPKDEQTLRRFWSSVFDGVKNAGRPMRIYPRAKGLPDLVIEIAVEKEMDFAIETKYVAEQMGMPFHPAHIQVQNQFDRRHGYADLLSYPKRYDILWRMWSWGSQKLLTWGSTDYTRQWVKSTSLYNDKGIFEVMEIEGAKPMGNGSVRALNDAYVYTDYEFQRYWYHNLLYGRLGYNPDSSDAIFEREFVQRFGANAGPTLMQAMNAAGMILPRITGFAMPDFQEARGVPEWGSGSGLEGKALLANYANVKPSDIQTFISMKEAAQLLLEGTPSGRIWPQQTALWFKQTAEKVKQLVDLAEAQIGSTPSKEFVSVVTDLRILAGMAEFHSIRIKAALAYNVYLLQNRNGEALKQAIAYDSQALEAYRRVVATVGDRYRTDLDISVSDTGHWQDELALLEQALLQLKQSDVKSSRPMPAMEPAGAASQGPQVEHDAVTEVAPGQPLKLTAQINSPAGIKWAKVYFRGLTQFQDYQTMAMAHTAAGFEVTIPAELIDHVVEANPETGALWDFMYFIEAVDQQGNGVTYPSAERSAPYLIAKVPHKTLEQTKGKLGQSRIQDITYASAFHDRPQFEMVTPINNDVFMDGNHIVVKLKHPWVDPDEKISIYVNGLEVNAKKLGDLEYLLPPLENGLYRVNAFVAKVGLIAWSETAEIIVGTTRN